MSESAFEPMTAREALLAIQREAEAVHSDSDVFEVALRITGLATAGLNLRAPHNFEEPDRIADKLAEAHRALKIVKEHLYGRLPDGDNEIEGIINEALVLPPDLEAMVERRIKS